MDLRPRIQCKNKRPPQNTKISTNNTNSSSTINGATNTYTTSTTPTTTTTTTSRKRNLSKLGPSYCQNTNSKGDNNNANNNKEVAVTTVTTTSSTTTTESKKKPSTSSTCGDFAQLPTVCLAKVFSYLSVSDRLNASSSCKQWRCVLFATPCLWRHVELNVFLLSRSWSDVKSAQFKATNLLKYVERVVFKYDPSDLRLVEKLVEVLSDGLRFGMTNLKVCAKTQNFIHLLSFFLTKKR